MFQKRQQTTQKQYKGTSGDWWKVAVFTWLAIVSNTSLFWVLAIFFGIKLVMDIKMRRNWENPQSRPGPLEARREAQMRKYEQMPQPSTTTSSASKPSPLKTSKANPYNASGVKKYKEFDLQDAIDDFKKGLEISPNDMTLHFNIACAYSLTENKKLAFDHINRAVVCGLKDFNKILQHDDLAFVRIQPEFDSFRKSGFAVNPYGTPTPTPVVETTNDEVVMDNSLLAQLSRLAEMRQNGALSDDEFILERKKLLRQ